MARKFQNILETAGNPPDERTSHQVCIQCDNWLSNRVFKSYDESSTARNPPIPST